MEITPLSTTWWLQAEIKRATSHHLTELKEKGLGKNCSPTIAETNELINGTHSRNDLHVDIYPSIFRCNTNVKETYDISNIQ